MIIGGHFRVTVLRFTIHGSPFTQLSFLLHTRIGKVFCAGNAVTEKPGVLLGLPVAFHLLDLNRIRLKVDPLSPSAALSKDGQVREAI